VTFSGTPVFGGPITQVVVGLSSSQTTLQHVSLVGDTPQSIAKAFELIINNGFTGIRAQASGAVLTIYSKSMGLDGNTITLSASPTTGGFQAHASGACLREAPMETGRTDLTATQGSTAPRGIGA